MGHSAADLRGDALKMARDLWAEEKPGPHIAPELLQRYVEGKVKDGDEVTAIRLHLARCEVCLRKEIRIETGPPFAFEPRRLTLLGWETAAVPLAAGHEAVAYESLTEGEASIDLQISLSDELFVTALERREPLIGWLVRLERVDAAGTVIAEERSETTDARGRVSLGSVRTLQPLQGEQRFRVVVIAPWE